MNIVSFISAPFQPFQTFSNRSASLHSLKPTFLSPKTLPTRHVINCTATGGQSQRLAWVDAIPIADVQPGQTYRRILSNLDICFACDEGGEIYALGNKGPPLGIPLSDGTVVTVDGESYVQCPQYGTLFLLSTGEVKEGSWIPSPPLISTVLRLIFKDPVGVVSFPVREQNGMLQTCININARSEFEQKYWKGVLDASGKADGGYF